MKSHLVSAVLAVAVSATPVAALDKSDVLERELAFATAATREVVIDNVFGSVAVRAGAGDRVTVEIRRRAEARRADDLELAFSEVTLEVFEEPGRIELVQDGPFRCDDHGWNRQRRRGDRRGCRWDPDYELDWQWTVTVPADVDLDVSSVNGGAVEVDGVTGRIEAGNVNGGIRLVGLTGAVEASTVNGPIRAEFARRPAAEGSFQTVNGEIELALPSGSGAEIAFETMNGEIYTDFEVTAVPQQATVSNQSGGRRYRLDRDAVVRIGAGGPRFDCQTLNGDIVVRER